MANDTLAGQPAWSDCPVQVFVASSEAPSPPLALLARRLAFTDPFTGEEREFLSARSLAEGADGADGADGPGRPGPGVSTLEP